MLHVGLCKLKISPVANHLYCNSYDGKVFTHEKGSVIHKLPELAWTQTSVLSANKLLFSEISQHFLMVSCLKQVNDNFILR